MVEGYNINDINSGKKKNKYAHSGHRQRMKKRYKEHGFDSFEFHEILELILFHAIPRSNTNSIAHELERKFEKSLTNILEAEESALKDIKGISENTVLFFRLLADITRKYNVETVLKSAALIDKPAYEKYLLEYYSGISVETFILITLNNRTNRLSHNVIYTGNVNSSKVDFYKMVKIAMNNNASSVVVAHNHPDGPSFPSPEDMETTKRINRLFDEIGINFIDHYVVSGTEISSIKDKLRHDYL